MTAQQTDILQTPIEFLKGVGEKRGAVLRKEFNIQTFNDLLYYFPYRHIDKSHVYHVSDIVNEIIRILEATQQNLQFDKELPVLCDLEHGRSLNPNAFIAQTGIHDGSRLMLV